MTLNTRVRLRIINPSAATGAICEIGIGAQPVSDPPHDGCCSATALSGCNRGQRYRRIHDLQLVNQLANASQGPLPMNANWSGCKMISSEPAQA
jgi:hypothetical protein